MWTAIVFGQCLRFMVSNFLTDSSNLFDRARFYPSGMIVLFLNLFIYKLVLFFLMNNNEITTQRKQTKKGSKKVQFDYLQKTGAINER